MVSLLVINCLQSQAKVGRLRFAAHLTTALGSWHCQIRCLGLGMYNFFLKFIVYIYIYLYKKVVVVTLLIT